MARLCGAPPLRCSSKLVHFRPLHASDASLPSAYRAHIFLGRFRLAVVGRGSAQQRANDLRAEMESGYSSGGITRDYASDTFSSQKLEYFDILSGLVPGAPPPCKQAGDFCDTDADCCAPNPPNGIHQSKCNIINNLTDPPPRKCEVVIVGTGCGDGNKEGDEECDNGTKNGTPNNACDASCKVKKVYCIWEPKFSPYASNKMGCHNDRVCPSNGWSRLQADGEGRESCEDVFDGTDQPLNTNPCECKDMNGVDQWTEPPYTSLASQQVLNRNNEGAGFETYDECKKVCVPPEDGGSLMVVSTDGGGPPDIAGPNATPGIDPGEGGLFGFFSTIFGGGGDPGGEGGGDPGDPGVPGPDPNDPLGKPRPPRVPMTSSPAASSISSPCISSDASVSSSDSDGSSSNSSSSSSASIIPCPPPSSSASSAASSASAAPCGSSQGSNGSPSPSSSARSSSSALSSPCSSQSSQASNPGGSSGSDGSANSTESSGSDGSAASSGRSSNSVGPFSSSVRSIIIVLESSSSAASLTSGKSSSVISGVSSGQSSVSSALMTLSSNASAASNTSVSSRLSCISPAQCPSGQCAQGLCVPQSSSSQIACTSPEQCGTNFCRNGLCEACVSPAQCASGQCVQGTCLPSDPFPPYIPSLNAQVLPPSPLCGNNILNGFEECDDGNTRDLDGCSSYCLYERGTCGDRVVQSLLGEQCEPGIQNMLPCAESCRYFLVSCGDGKPNAGEACDQGLQNSNLPGSLCRPDCSLARCGDRILDTGEQCDDGNRLPGDRCDAFCRMERAGANQTLPATVIDLPFTPSAPEGLSVPQTPSDLSEVPKTTDSGPETLLVMAGGAAAGYAWMRRRRI
jgi:cysteine-rich repeat protein